VSHVEIIDQTLRDGVQSLWGMRIRAGMVTEPGRHLDRAGYHTVELPSGSFFSVLLRYLHEDPIEAYKHMRGCLPTTRVRGGTRPSSTGRYGISPYSILDFISRYTIQKLGIDSYWIYDCLFNMPEMEHRARVVHDAGGLPFPAVMYGLSPVHTDEWFAERVREMVSWGVAAGIYVEDAAGILTPERARTLLPALVEAAGHLPVELHCHNTTGLAPVNYLIGVESGVKVLHTCSRPVANGPSLPSTEMTLVNLEAAGHTHSIDTATLEPVARQMERVARQEGHPIGVPEEYDARIYEHQLPGGMTGTFKAQLAQHGMEDRLRAVLDETPRVREELGYPVSATPFSQLVGTQAVLNIIAGERYAQTTDEVVLYVMGAYGEPPAPVDPDVKDRVLSSSRAKALAGWERPDKTLDEVREEYGGRHLSDEELFRRHFAPVEDIEVARAAGPVRRNYPLGESLADLIAGAQAYSSARRVRLETAQGSVELRR
jgi:oxaloacetate decarboxylase (Na+ extruding) subunit alpha